MHHLIKDYITTWKLDLLFVITLAVDALTWLVGGSLLSFAVFQIKRQASALAAGNYATTIQNYMLTLPPEQLAVFSAQLKAFVIQFIAVLIVVPLILLVLYAASRALIWNTVEKSGDDNYRIIYEFLVFFFVFPLIILLTLRIYKWIAKLRGKTFTVPFRISIIHKWIATVLLLGVVLFGYGFVVIILRQGFLLLPVKLFAVLYSILLAIAMVHFFILAFLVKRNLAKTHLVWRSIGDAFAALKHQKKTLLFGTVTLLALQIIQLPLKNWYFVYPTQGTIVQLVLFVFFTAWLRTVVVKTTTYH